MFKSAQEIKRNLIRSKFLKLWNATFKFHNNGLKEEELINSLKILEQTDLVRPEIIIAFSLEKFEPLYISKNAEKVVGYSVEELLKAKSFLFFKLLSIQQLGVLFKLLNWLLSFWKLKPEITAKQLELYFCGIRSKPINGKSKTFLIRSSYIKGIQNELPKNIIFYLTDVTHLYRADFYWTFFRRISSDGELTKLYRSDLYDKESANLITDREKEILVQYSYGKSNKEIAAHLNISTGTVEKHRRNMLEKTGAKDSTALIHFCKLTKVL